jgi:hypothetical protein
LPLSIHPLIALRSNFLDQAIDIYDVYESGGHYVPERARLYFVKSQVLECIGDGINAHKHLLKAQLLWRSLGVAKNGGELEVTDFDDLIGFWSR